MIEAEPVQQLLELRPYALDLLQIVRPALPRPPRARRPHRLAAAGATSPSAARAASPAARAASRTRSLIAPSAGAGRAPARGPGALPAQRPAPRRVPPTPRQGGAATGHMRGRAADAGPRRNRTGRDSGSAPRPRTMKVTPPKTIPAAPSSEHRATIKADDERGHERRDPAHQRPEKAVLLVALRHLLPSQARRHSSLIRSCACGVSPSSASCRACSTQPSRVTRPWKPSRFSSTQATSSGCPGGDLVEMEVAEPVQHLLQHQPDALDQLQIVRPLAPRRRQARRPHRHHRRPIVAPLGRRRSAAAAARRRSPRAATARSPVIRATVSPSRSASVTDALASTVRGAGQRRRPPQRLRGKAPVLRPRQRHLTPGEGIEQPGEPLRRQVLVVVLADLRHRRVGAGPEALDLLPARTCRPPRPRADAARSSAGRPRSGPPPRRSCRTSCRRPAHAQRCQPVAAGT